MTAIFQSFAEHKIETPFPKRDLYLKSLPSSWQEKVERPSEITSSNRTNQKYDKDENKKSSEI
jgi:small-conductance mechanosensitive channel